jgi:hypothetical protein
MPTFRRIALFAVALTLLPRISETAVPSNMTPATLRVEYLVPAVHQPIRQDPSLLFYDDFDSGNLAARYFEYSDADGSFVQTPNEGYGGKGGAMKCQFEKGQVTAGSLKVLFGRSPFHRGLFPEKTFKDVYWRAYVKHETGWQGNPAKLARATCLATENWSQGFIAHVWGGKGDALCIDPATGITDNRRVSVKYNDFDHLHWLGMKNGQTPIFSPQESGRWVCVESHIRMNTPGKSDGIFELWVDGKLEAAHNDLNWHGTWDDYAINAVFLENYWNEGAIKREARWFDEFAIVQKPIGPMVVPRTPTLVRTAGNAGEWQAQVSNDPSEGKALWTSKPVSGKAISLKISPDSGTFSELGRKSLKVGQSYWLRLRQKSPDGSWSAWSPWHSPFKV